MPLPATANMGLVRPTELGDAGLWASLVNTIFSQIDLHDHSNGRGVRIPALGLNIDGDVSWHSHKIQSIAGVGFNEVSGSGPDTRSIFVADGTGGTLPDELYWCTVDGDLVQLTSGTSLNVAAFTGGIVGDYSVVGAVVTYDTATKRYKFETSTGDGHGWARLMTGGVRIGILNDTNNSHYVEHAVDGAITGAYTVTWPAALPAAKSIITIDTSGVVGTGPASLPASKAVVTIDASGTISTSTPYTGTLTLPIAAAAFDIEGAAQGAGTALLGDGQWTFGGAEVLAANVALPVGAVITGYDIYANRGGAGTITVELTRKTLGTKTSINTTTINSGTGMVKTVGSSTSLPHTTLIDNQYYVRVTCTNGANIFEHIEVRYTI